MKSIFAAFFIGFTLLAASVSYVFAQEPALARLSSERDALKAPNSLTVQQLNALSGLDLMFGNEVVIVGESGRWELKLSFRKTDEGIRVDPKIYYKDKGLSADCFSSLVYANGSMEDTRCSGHRIRDRSLIGTLAKMELRHWGSRGGDIFTNYWVKNERQRLLSIVEKNSEKKRQEEMASLRLEQERLRLAEEARAAQENLKEELAKVRESMALQAKALNRDWLAEDFKSKPPLDRNAIQEKLRERGFYKSTIDGFWGAGTKRAIVAYAESNNAPDYSTETGAQSLLNVIISLAEIAPKKETQMVSKSRTPLDLSKQSNAKLYLDDLREFIALNPTEFDALRIAGLYSPAVGEVQNRTFNKPGSKFLGLTAYVGQSTKFTEYQDAQQQKRQEAGDKARASALASISSNVSALEKRLVANPLAPDAYQLSQVILKYKNLKDSEDIVTLIKLRNDLMVEAKKLGVSTADNSQKTAGNSSQPVKISTVDLKALSDVQAEDIVVLVNLDETAPHAFRDLSGKVVFQNNTVKACAPSLSQLKPQYLAFYEVAFEAKAQKHNIEIQTNCRGGIKGLDALILSGTDLSKSQDIPTADQLVAALSQKSITRLLTVKMSDFQKEVAKREILSSQYKRDIEEGARVGFGAITFRSSIRSGCTIVERDIEGHDEAISEVSLAHYFLTGEKIVGITNGSATEAFRKVQKKDCSFVYGSSDTLKKIIDAATTANLKAQVLPVWITNSAVKKRLTELSRLQANQSKAEGERRAELQKRQALEQAKNEALSEQLETRQRQYRNRFGAKVASLVSTIDGQLSEIRGKIDGALGAKQGVKDAIAGANFWGAYPSWYADQRVKGWEFESTVHAPLDYGVATWRGRQVESITAQIKVLMKNRALGEYSNTCWNVGYLLDAEFNMNRESFAARCENPAEHKEWQANHAFETRWDLGIK